MARDAEVVETGIELSLEFFPLAFFLLFCTPRVTIGDRDYRRPWGRHFFPLRPGRHAVEVSYPYLFLSEAGRASLVVRLAEGEVRRLSYYHLAFLVFLPGSLSDRGTATEPRTGGSLSVKVCLGFLLAMVLSPFLCCGGFFVLGAFAQRQGEADRAARQQAESDGKARQLQFSTADAFAKQVGARELGQARLNTTAAYRERVDAAAFEALLARHDLPGAVFLADGRPAGAAPALAYLALVDVKATRRVVLTMAPAGEFWAVDELAVEDSPERPEDVITRLAQARVADFFRQLERGQSDSAYYQETSAAFKRRVTLPEFTGRVGRRLAGRPQPLGEKMELTPDGWHFDGRYRVTSADGVGMTLALSLRRDGTELRVEDVVAE